MILLRAPVKDVKLFKVSLKLLVVYVTVIVISSAALLIAYEFFEKKNIVILVVYGDSWLIKIAQTKLTSAKYLTKVIEIRNETLAKELCKRLLRVDAALPTLVLLEGNGLRAVVIGAPSERLWEQILGRLSRGGAFLAFSVKEELLPWRCITCPTQGRLVEEMWDMPEEEVRSVLEIIRKS
jgi:hypothetical protein